MNRKKWTLLAGFALAMISLGWGTGEQRQQQKEQPDQSSQPASQVERHVAFVRGSEKMPRMRSTTAAMRKAAALRVCTNGPHLCPTAEGI